MYASGSTVAFATFNARGTDKMSWLSADRLINSSWDDVREFANSNPTTISVIGRYV